MAADSGCNERRFVDMFPELMRNVQLNLIEYAKLLKREAAGSNLAQPPLPVAKHKLDIPTEDGFPVMPGPGDIDGLKKDDLEELLRRYLNAHYSKSSKFISRPRELNTTELASGNDKLHVPFGALSAHPRTFVDAKYCPRNFSFKDPRNMTKGSIVELCNHIRGRQEENGVRDAFRFRKYYNGKEVITTAYGIDKGQETAAARAMKQKHTRDIAGKKKKGKSKKGKADEMGTNTLVANLPTHSDVQQTPHVHTAGPAPPDGDPLTHPNHSDTVTHQTNIVLDQSTIDPALLANTEVSRSSIPAADNPRLDNSTLSVNDSQMQILIKSGCYSSLLPINGPNEGPPRYCVPAAAQQILDKHKTIELDHDNQAPQSSSRTLRSHPAGATGSTSNLRKASSRMLRSQPAPITPSTENTRSSRKRTVNADTRAMQEAKELLSTNSSRGRKVKRRR